MEHTVQVRSRVAERRPALHPETLLGRPPAPAGQGSQRLPRTWCPTVFLCSLVSWPGLPLVGFEGTRLRGVRPEGVAEVGLMAFSSS